MLRLALGDRWNEARVPRAMGRSFRRKQLSTGVVAASAGNHALGVAWAVQALGGGVPAVLFVPESVPRAKLEKLRCFPVTVRETGASYEVAYDASLAYAEAEGARYLHPFEDPLTAAGQGTVGLEILEQLPEVGQIVVPVGGGGLISAIAVAVKARTPGVRIVAVHQHRCPPPRPLAGRAVGTPRLVTPA